MQRNQEMHHQEIHILRRLQELLIQSNAKWGHRPKYRL